MQAGRKLTKKRLSPEERNREAVKHLAKLCQAVLNGQEEKAEQLAWALTERYGF